MKTPIYLDYSATTPVDPRVVEAMVGCLGTDGVFGNPASRSHAFGWQAEQAVEHARGQVADLIGADPREIVFTSGATESDNLALKGAAHFHRERGRHIITSSIEHKAVLDSCKHLETEGFEVTYLCPEPGGEIAPASLAAALRDDTILVSLMHANNETGVLNDIAALGALCRERGALFHTDAAQSVGKVAINLKELPVDLLSISGHKMYGPKGVGALYVRRQPRVLIEPQMHGGGHERGMRSGTLPTHQIVGLGEAARIAAEQLEADEARITAMRDAFWETVRACGDVELHGETQPRLPGVLNIGFGGVEGETLLMALKDIAVSSGSACSSATVEPSHVLRGMGVEDQLAHSSLRITLGRFTTDEEARFAAEKLCETLVRLRQPRPRSGTHDG
ncbi:MAG: IscS subfamily cysteine desulfurase [Halieaceae bacterium]|nr:IscS subfamily cysteine desulfurase [Halieaceae bacterium]